MGETQESGSVDDELAYLQERVRSGEPRRSAPGEPLSQRIEALTQLYVAGRRQALLERIVTERDAAGPVWFDYWDGLHSGLHRNSKLRQEATNYEIAAALAVLCTRHGQPLAKAILRELGPQCESLSRAESRIVRVLGAGLDPREDFDARLLLVDLLEHWGLDGKSELRFLHALHRAGLDACLPVLERRLTTSLNDQKAVLKLLTSRDETTPSVALREAIATWADPSWLTFQVVLRGDREALPALHAALGRLIPAFTPAQMVQLAIRALTAEAPVPASLSLASLLPTLRGHMYGRLDLGLPEAYEWMGNEETPKARTSLSEQLLAHAEIFSLWGWPCDRLDELTRWHGLDPRLSPELSLVVLAEAAREDPRPEIRSAACHAIWNLGMLEID